jgi:hypothetical protein
MQNAERAAVGLFERMRVGERAGDLSNDEASGRGRQATIQLGECVEDRAQGPAVDQLHGDVVIAFDVA